MSLILSFIKRFLCIADFTSFIADLALLAVSSLISNTFSIIQQGHDVTWYAEVVTVQFARKQTLPSNDAELAISGGSYGVDLVLYYFRESQSES